MKENRISLTAISSAYTRGYHVKHDNPKIFDDFLAEKFFSEEEWAAFEQSRLASFRSNNPAAEASFSDQAATLAWMMQSSGGPPLILARSRYTEEILVEAVREGVKQYVILGAGLDTFAFRRPDLVQQLRIFEVDHPATQAYKLHRLAGLGWELPPQLHFVAVDFSRENLAAALAGSPYNPDEPTLFSWLGVSYYLSREAVFATLRSVTEIAPAGSTVIFDYLDSDAFIPRKAAPRAFGMLLFAQEMGEPMQTGFEPLTLADDIASLGLRLQEDLSPIDIQRRYFLGCTDFYRACEDAHYARVVVDISRPVR